MAKKDQAYELFSQGKKKGDIEVLDIGLKTETLRKYYRAWEAAQPAVEEAPIVVAPPEPTGVQLGSLNVPAKFEFKGEKYRVASKIEDSVVVDKFREVTSDEETVWQHLAHLTLSPLVIVRPIK